MAAWRADRTSVSADAAVFWDSATMYSKYIPGAVVYSVKSIPDLIEQLEQLAGTAISNQVAYGNLVGGLPFSGACVTHLVCCPVYSNKHRGNGLTISFRNRQCKPTDQSCKKKCAVCRARPTRRCSMS